MATEANEERATMLDSDARHWNEFAYRAFARIVARKHNSVPPDTNFTTITDGELERRVRLLSELAHLPPA